MTDHIVLKPEDHYTLGGKEFGMEGLIAIESVGPFTDVLAIGPLITVHDSVIYAGQGIGHHPHRWNERLFYLEKGTFDHDDMLNDVQGHVTDGGMARFTEGQRGMIHKEWNNGNEDTEIFILVATTDPVPQDMKSEILERKDMPVVEEAPGVRVRYMVGGGAPLKIYSDIRTFSDTEMNRHSHIDWEIPADEGGLLSVREGSVSANSDELGKKWTLLLPPPKTPRTVALKAHAKARIIRATFGWGEGLVRRGDVREQ
jgi:redox-sensitive bicupin YhaK (pirin superfamily)